jgi:hypothetical protein
VLTLLLMAAIMLGGGVTALAADAVPPRAPSAAETLHSGAPPSMPGAAATAAPETTETADITPNYPLSFTLELSAEPAETSGSEAADPPLYPSDVQGALESGARRIIKTYELSAEESPDAIPRSNFELDGWRYELTDILKKETAAADTREHTENVTVSTETKEMAAIIKLLAPTLDFSSEDGYAGTLTLDIATVKVEQAGTKTSGYTMSATREYPHLSAPDTALIPKTIAEGGRTLTLASVDWRTQNTETIDYEALPGSYTAVASYTAAASRTVVTGYVTTAEYKGTIAKLIAGKTVYTAYFAGTPIAPERGPMNPVPAAGTAAGAGLLGGVVFFFFLRRNVKVLSLKEGKYIPVGKTRITAKSPVVNLTPFADKAVTGSFILILGALTAKALSGKTITVNYGDRSLQHIVASGGGEYQFEVDF